ncbi:MAG TPA: hypothetical protein IAA58_07155 [Candidatus Gallacutalibacter stercoravium]|nr:hypothetical protein [Candidatus Gallacutalibacter stercoravium]
MAARKRLKLTTPKQVRQALNRVANMVLNGEIEAKDANAIMYACNITLGAIRADEQQAKLDELEKVVKELGINNGWQN